MNLRQEKKEKIVRVAIILDESGSMGPLKKETVSGLNEYIQELQNSTKLGITTYVSLITFSGPDNIKVKYNNVLASKMPEIKNEDYNPNGMTATFDAIALGINNLKTTEDTEDTTYILCVITDGQENTSKEYTEEEVRKMIKNCKATKKWTIVYIGANQDLKAVSKSLNISGSNVLNYNSTSEGTRNVYRCASASTGRYMTARANDITNNIDENFFATDSQFIGSTASTTSSS